MNASRGGPEAPDVTRAMRIADIHRNERIVLAESALLGERVMAIFRLVLLATIAVSQAFAEAVVDAPERESARGAGIALYIVSVGVSIIAMRRATPNPRRAFIYPFVTSTIDFSFMFWMDYCDLIEEGSVSPAVSAIARAVILSFCAVRFAQVHIVYSVALACASYAAAVHVGGGGDLRVTAFVIACFVVLGLVFGWTSRRLHTMFGDVRRRDNLSRFLPPAVADRMLREGETALRPVQREVSVLFFDLRDFTTLSESLSPQEVLELLDEQLGSMAQVVKEQQGMVNKFLGDGMLALWGVPDVQPDHAERALTAALAMRAKLAELNAIRQQLGSAPLRMGIGLHTGVVAAGMLGGADQHEYAVIGDAVNVASRVEGLTKRHGVDILATARTLELAPGKVRAKRLGEEVVKGRAATVEIYAVEGLA